MDHAAVPTSDSREMPIMLIENMEIAPGATEIAHTPETADGAATADAAENTDANEAAHAIGIAATKETADDASKSTDDSDGTGDSIDDPNDATQSGQDAANIHWEVEHIEDAGPTPVTAKFSTACGVFVRAVVQGREETWVIFCPECLATGNDDNGSNCWQGMTGLQKHIVFYHPGSTSCKGVETSSGMLNKKTVLYIRGHCRLYEGQVHPQRLQVIMDNPRLMGRFFFSPMRSIRHRKDELTKLIDGEFGKANYDPRIVRYTETNGKRCASAPCHAKRWAHLTDFPTVVKTDSSGSAHWSRLSCKRCGGNCANGGKKYFKGVNGLHVHLNASHAFDEPAPSCDQSWEQFVDMYCDAVRVDPRTVRDERDVPKVPGATMRSLREERMAGGMFPGLRTGLAGQTNGSGQTNGAGETDSADKTDGADETGNVKDTNGSPFKRRRVRP
jgi:hypothetical protein